ncbi:MAG: hypothetical protein HKN09_10680 [Saprospiraceae bacterium]|nr:hypothetical protein [Saprospiraceae bacterium]
MNFMKIYSLLCICVFAIVSCDNTIPEPLVISNFDQEFVIRPWQDLTSVDNNYQLIVQSLQEQECLNSQLDVSYEIMNNTIAIHINGISLDGPCNPGYSQPQAIINLDVNPGSYDLEIQVGSSIQNLGVIDISDETLHLNFDETSGFNFEQDSILKIQDGICWGYLDNRFITEPELNSVANQIFESINQITSLPEGNYGHFVIGDFNVLHVYGADDDVTSMLLDMRKEDNWQLLKSILAEFTMKYPDAKYEFTRWDGLQIWN